MTAQTNTEPLRPVDALTVLIAHHGLIRILLALPGALLQRRRDRLLLGYALTPHLQRDIGLDPDRSRFWDRR